MFSRQNSQTNNRHGQPNEDDARPSLEESFDDTVAAVLRRAAVKTGDNELDGTAMNVVSQQAAIFNISIRSVIDSTVFVSN